MPRKHKEDVMVEPGQGLNLDPELIKQLVPGMLDRSHWRCSYGRSRRRFSSARWAPR